MVHRLGGSRRDIGILRRVSYEIRIGFRLAHHLIAAADIAGDGQSRQQQAVNEESRAPARIPRLGAQPVMNADASMDTYRYQRDDLHGSEPRPMQPLADENRVVVYRDVERAFGDARSDDMDHQQKRNAQAERELRQFPAIESQ